MTYTNIIDDCSSSCDNSETLATIRVMRRQEETAYATSDYLDAVLETMTNEDPVDSACRSIMTQWCYQILDFCSYKRETAEICLSLLDRFLATPDGYRVLLDRSQFQLAAMTALYTSVKIHEHEAMEPELVSKLSQGAHSKEAVEVMELRMLTAVGWRVNPPTAMSFARRFLDLVPSHLLDDNLRNTVLDLTQFQIELAVSDYDFITQRPSCVAFGSALNALESLGDAKLVAEFDTTISQVAGLDSSNLEDLRLCLYEAISEQEAEPLVLASGQQTAQCGGRINTQRSVHTSPRSVSH